MNDVNARYFQARQNERQAENNEHVRVKKKTIFRFVFVYIVIFAFQL